MCHQAKTKNAEKSFSQSREIKTDSQKHVANYWWSVKKMNDEMGEEKKGSCLEERRQD